MKKLVLSSILISMAIVLSYLERLLPIELIVPFPGIKLGLTNIVTLFALFYLDYKSAFVINIFRCVIVAMLFGSMSSFLFSFFGAIASLIVMAFLKIGYNRFFSIIGISIGGAAAHNIGQILVAFFILRAPEVFAYLTILLISSLITGLLTAVVSGNVLHHMDKLKLLN